MVAFDKVMKKRTKNFWEKRF